MESNEQIIVGLDIGTTKIACLVGKKNEYGKLELLGMGKAESVGVRRGVVSHITPAVEAIRKAVEKAGLNSGCEIKVVNVGIAGQHIKSLQHRGVITLDNLEDEISMKDVDALIQDMHKLVLPPGESIIHVLPQDFIVDNESGIKDPIGMSGIRLEANFHIITGLVTAIQNIFKCVQKSDLEIADLTLEPLASAASVLSDEEREAGVVLVDIGGGTTDVAIFQDGIIRHTSVIPFGGNIITDDIKEGCTIIRKQAELLKVKFGSALASENQANDIVVIPGLSGREPKEISVKNLAHIIQARMEEIIEQVYFEIRNSGFERKLIAGIVITGGGAQLKHLPQLFEYLTGMDTRIGYPTEHLASGNDKVASPMYATGVGLVLKGFEYAERNNRKESSVSARKPKKKATSGLFDKLLNKGKEWFEEDDNL
ncbi:cell division protein FtsA [Salibacteraceae bacterium]|jgi:cell division protein FtsA|nr:cell division protein FtsA [Salibacteraceae bacterium]